MGFRDEGIELLQKRIRGTSSLYPTHIIFSEETDVDPEVDDISTPLLIKEISWTASGKNSIYTAQISSLELVGYDIRSSALVDDETLGTGNQWTINSSNIQEKTDTVSIQVVGEVIVRRPL
jgi:hypothetical protein